MDHNHPHDTLDTLLFDTAAQLTAQMQFDSAWAQIQATHRRGRRHKALKRYMPLAATLVVGLGLGVLLAPLLPSKGAESVMQEPPALDIPAPSDPAAIADAPENIPESVVVEGPNGSEEYIVVDPPKTSGPGVEEATPGETRPFPHLAGKTGIDRLYPGWLPENIDYFTFDLANGSWRATGPGESANSYCALQAGLLDTPPESAPALEIGEGFPTYLRMEGDSAPTWSEWIIRLEEDTYLYAYSEYMDFADVEQVLAHIGLAPAE